jgi:transposase
VLWLIRRHLSNVLTYVTRRITTASLEAVIAAIHWIERTARGFRNVEHFKRAIS